MSDTTANNQVFGSRFPLFNILTKSWISILAFIVAFCGIIIAGFGLIIAQAEYNKLSFSVGRNPFDLQWFRLFYDAVMILCMLLVVITDAIPNYRFVLIAFVSVGFVLLINGFDDAITVAVDYHGSTLGNASGALAAGCFFLAVAYIIWIFLLGAEENTTAAKILHGGAIPLKHVSVGGFGGSSSSSGGGGLFGRKRRETAVPTQPVVIPTPSAGTGGSSSALYAAAPATNSAAPATSSAAPAPAAGAVRFAEQVYNYKAKTLYSYDANPEDPNEMSFQKGEILDILDNKGKWWQARRTTIDEKVTVGIVPSNYLQLQ